MALPKFTSTLGKGLAIGVGAVVLAPVVTPAVAKVTKPLLKSTIKTGLIMYEKAKIVGAEAVETLEDLTAEARAEIVAQQKAAAAEKAGGGK